MPTETAEELRQIDVRIAREVMGLNVFWGGDPDEPKDPHDDFHVDLNNGRICERVLSYTSSDADALKALDKLCSENHILYRQEVSHTYLVGEHPEYRVKLFWSEQANYLWSDWVRSRPLSVCRAIIAYLDWQKEQRNAH